MLILIEKIISGLQKGQKRYMKYKRENYFKVLVDKNNKGVFLVEVGF